MRQIAVVAWREIVECRVFIWAAFGALAMTLVVPLVPTFFGWSPGEVREVMTWVMALGFTWISSVVLGLSTVSGSVMAERFGFFLNRPLNGIGIWFGKVLGVLVVLLACQLIVVLPAALLTEPGQVMEVLVHNQWVWVTLLVGIPLLIVLVSHALATMFRAKSPLIAVDLVLIAAIAGVTWLMLEPLLRAEAVMAVAAIGGAVLGAVSVALVAAGAVEAARGGADPKRHHRVFSASLWSVVAVLLVGIFGYWIWMNSPDLKDVRGVSFVGSEPGVDFIVVEGPVSGRFDFEQTFLIDLDSGDSWRLRPGSRWTDVAMAFSDDGRWLAWTECVGEKLWQVSVADVSGGSLNSRATMIFTGRFPKLDLSPAGDLVALIDEDLVSVVDVETGETRVSGRLPDDTWHLGPVFVDSNTVRVIANPFERGQNDPSRTSQVIELDIGAGTSRYTVLAEEIREVAHAVMDRTGERTLMASHGDRGWSWFIIDDFRAFPLEFYEEHEGILWASLLADGRVIRINAEPDGVWLELQDRDGEVKERWPLPDAKSAAIGGQYARERVVIGLHDEAVTTNTDGWRSISFDLQTGEIDPIGPDLMPLRSWGYWSRYGQILEPDNPATRLFLRNDLALVLWNPENGDLREIVPGIV